MTFYLQEGLCNWSGQRPQTEPPSISREPRVFIDQTIHANTVENEKVLNKVIGEVDAETWLEAKKLFGY